MSDPVIEVAVPMRDAHGLTRNLLRDLCADGAEFDRLRIYDNGSANTASVGWLRTIERSGRYGAEVVRWGPARGIYGMWNAAITAAVARQLKDPGTPVHLAILNNDLLVPPGFLGHLSRALAEHADAGVWITYPDWPLGWPHPVEVSGEVRPTTGTRNAGGMAGYAFMLDIRRFVEGLPLIDEGYVWLAGDGDLVVKVQDRGGTAAAVVGLPVGHLEKASSDRHSWTLKQGRADMRRSREPGRHNARPGG